MEVAFRLVDVFTETPFTGNQLCVVPEPPSELDDVTMQVLALEIGFSETTYVTAAGGDRYHVRIFTPAEELPFAGHPTLGTAYTLVAEGRVDPEVVQVSAAGDVPVSVDVGAGFAWMRQLPPTFSKPFDDRELVARAAGLDPGELVADLPIQVVSTGIGHLLAPVRDESAVRRAIRDGAACDEIRRRTGGESVYLFTVRSAGDVLARMFDSSHGIEEDPATGSAAGPLGAYLAANALAGMPGRVVVAQGEFVGRPSFLHVEVEAAEGSWSVRVGGGVRLVGEGVFRL
jgi:trans-2,3-dihydro-3-hydroxyanthranilate isomerase